MTDVTTTETHPILTDQLRAHFAAFGVTQVYPVVVTVDVKTRAGNVLAHAGERTWGGYDSYGASSLMIATPNHYAGILTSSIIAGAHVDYDHPVRIAR